MAIILKTWTSSPVKIMVDELQVGAGEGGKYRVVLDSDAPAFGGHGRVGHDVDHFTQPEGVPGGADEATAAQNMAQGVLLFCAAMCA